MSRKLSDDTQLVGFTYSDVHASIRDPDGAFITETKVDSEVNAIMSIEMRWIPIAELYEMVEEGIIKELRVKEGELVLKVMRKSMRKASTARTVAKIGGEAAVTHVATKGVKAAMAARTAVAADAAVGAVAEATCVEVAGASVAAAETAVATGTVAAEAAVVTGETAAVAAGGAAAGGLAATATAAIPPIMIALGVSIAVSVTVKALTGAITRHKIYEYTPMRMISQHVELAEKSAKHIAVCVAGFERNSAGLSLTLFAYGVGARDYTLKLLKDCPELGNGVTIPNGNVTCIVAPYKLLSNPNFYNGFNLMFNTMNLHDEEIRSNIVKATKIGEPQLVKIAAVLDNMTENALKVPIATVIVSNKNSTSQVSVTPVSNIQAYCKKYGMTEEHFRLHEVGRLCSVLGCDEEGLEQNLTQLLA